MKILIVENIWMGNTKYGFFDKTLLNTFSILPTLYARKMAAITPKKHIVTVINERYSNINFDETYDIVNINFTTSTAHRAYEIAQKFKEKGVTVIAPTMGPKESPKVALKDFKFDYETGFIKSCPEGYRPKRVNKTKSNNLSARFSKEHCIECSRRNNCPVKFRKRVTYVQYSEKQLRLARRRAYEQTSEFRDKYRWRAGIEGTNSHYKSDTGAVRLRVRGLARVHFSAVLKALGLNILRSARALSFTFWSNFIRIFGLKTNFRTVKSSLHPLSKYYLSKNNIFYEFAL